MPYIEYAVRIKFNDLLHQLEPLNKGELNYCISKLVHNYCCNDKINYQNLSDARAAIQDAGDEFYRTVVAPYEDKKRAENGSVSWLDQ